MMFQDRRAAGQALAGLLEPLRSRPETVVLALPRGGVPVAFEVARHLDLPLDVFIVRKLGVPGQEELAMGAIASGGATVLNAGVIADLSIPAALIEQVASREHLEVERRELAYRDGLAPLKIDGLTVILVDDGIATGASVRAAVRALQPRVREIFVAVPVVSVSTCDRLASEVDHVVSVVTPRTYGSVGMYYHNFSQTTDEEVRLLLSQARSEATPTAA